MQTSYWRPAAAVLIAAIGLAGCKPAQTAEEDANQPSRHGRFVGVGIYSPGVPWAKLAAAPTPADPASARTHDDQAIIVVVDSDTGEVRACGDLSGYCISMNPWSHALLGPQIAPVALTDHAAFPAESPAGNGPAAHSSLPPARRPAR